jgi:peptide subunit release factor 1 (eRF1)
MRDVVYLDRIEQAEALLKPQRIEVLRQLAPHFAHAGRWGWGSEVC